MTIRLDVVSPRKRKTQGVEKTFWTKVGTYWESEGKRSITFDALPLPDAEGKTVVYLFEPRDKGVARPIPPAPFKDDLDDEIAF